MINFIFYVKKVLNFLYHITLKIYSWTWSPVIRLTNKAMPNDMAHRTEAKKKIFEYEPSGKFLRN